MLDKKLLRKLESMRELPSIPTVISQVLNAIDNPNMSATQLASMIEQDQTLTGRVLRVANSPFYGFARKISTIELAVVVMGINTIKEILMSLIIQKFFSKINPSFFDINAFWQYSVFCGACSRVLSRKLGYRLVGEAFVAGLMHDIGILVLLRSFRKEFEQIKELLYHENISLIEAERKVLSCTHCDIGAWIANKWNLPERICESILHHHIPFMDVMAMKEKIRTENGNTSEFGSIDEPLTAIVSLSEWFASEMGFYQWSIANKESKLYLSKEIVDDFGEHDVLDQESALEMLKQDIMEEYEKAAVLKPLPTR